MPEPNEPRSLAHRVLAVGVGLFAAWQLVYLPAANLIDFVPRRMSGPELEPIGDPYQTRGTFTSLEPLQRAAEWTGDALDFWSEVSGQEQGWSLFAPGPPPYSLIPAVEFRFADGTRDTLLSAYEPADLRNPGVRAPLVHDRLFNFEAQFIYAAWYAPPEEVAKVYAPPEEVEKLPESLRDLPESARVLRGPIRAWLAWRLKGYRAAHPDRPAPTEVILTHRYIPTALPSEPRGWNRPAEERPYVRWRPADDTLEAYDAVNKQFVPVREKP
ncbi:hypothetical protein [Frigoriglobus tundricola]|uniref:Uncharacterized protein n=1 Tax=Frigoriglobus tundricola TaxID=2774151 RepID=A0A6M5YY47_9BACT|nr:hypothetical protein [Frigoriglobus tundricola]QJW98133.1 hypothetical protein FTUN_5713 [Frigoriglobus tundricola]